MASSLQESFNRMKQMPILWFVSLAALLQSQLFWVFSIIYIAYHKFSAKEKEKRMLRWQPKIDVTRKKKKNHQRKKSLTSKPKSVIIPPVIPTKGTVTISLGTTTATTTTPTPTQHAPLLYSFNTFPSPKQKHQLATTTSKMIKSQRKMLRRSCSTGQLNISSLPALIEVDTRSSEESSICSSMSDDHMRKRDRAIGLLRSTFHRGHKSSNNLLLHKSNSAFSSEEEEEESIVIVEEKRRKRDAFFAEEIKKQKQQPTKPKLFRSLPSWRKRR
ncbi:hypothetical protein BD770DRAFT_79247 [Pilaira anomala]|nr:hypothetical protein BD770DRAFT_79247 [Pilaira anomala]